jgi:hypothetical protein
LEEVAEENPFGPDVDLLGDHGLFVRSFTTPLRYGVLQDIPFQLVLRKGKPILAAPTRGR